MKQALLAFLILSQVPCSGAEPVVEEVPGVPGQPGSVPQTWLGLKVEKPDESVSAQVAELPPGIGFLVKSLDQDGPAHKAGLKELDILWKFGDQLLVNESQLVALLRLAKPGEEIPLAVFRAGKPLEIKVALGKSPASEHAPLVSMGKAVDVVQASLPTRVVNLSDKTASVVGEEGKAEVWNEDGNFKVRISNPQQEIIHEGTVTREGSGEGVPENWHGRVRVLCRTLDQSLSGNLIPQRTPRPRVVIPASYGP